ncbi:MAG TPA: chemotaxis protein CheA [Candidatus Acidoferrales bacterium]|nr:chemotaxis protein CheA [Candidatus Acidoferrales bacterium]
MNFFGDDRGAELRELFFESAAELLQAMNEGGLELEERPGDPETIRKVRRAVHTLKGDSASCGYRELSALAHLLEDVLTPETFASNASALPEVVLTAADTFDEMLAAYRGDMQPPDGRALRELIDGVLQKPGEAKDQKAEKKPLVAQFAWTEYEQLMVSEAMKRGECVFFVAAHVAHDAPMPAAAVQLAKNALAASGTILAVRPEEGADLTEVRQVEAAISSTQTMDWIRKKCRIPSLISEVVVLPAGAAPTAHRDLLEILLESEAAAVASGVPAQESDSDVAETTPIANAETRAFANSAANVAPAGAENTLRVDAARIDDVMNLVGELIIGKSMLHRTIIEFEKQYAKDPLRGKLSDALAYQTRVLSDLQKSVMKIRMVPVEQLFRRFPRVVRDVAKQRSKDIAIEIAGQTTDLDKSILDALAEPLVHLVRNAADHGIETTAERVAAGKSPRGTIRLNAFHKASQVVIEVSDDGHGLDREKIVQRAIERGLVTSDEAARLNEHEALQLIFKPGLTTADEVTSISGRGVGMDVVHTVLERLKGTVEIQTELGKGTTFSLMLPLTLASIKALMFYAGGKLYAVPLSAVVEIARTQTSEITRVEDREVLRLRDQLLALVRLESSGPVAVDPKSKKLFVIVISTGPRKFGLVVDRLVGEEELVMKALEDRTAASDLVSGASILGDGTVVLILNVATVVAKMAKAPLGATA